MEKFTLKQMQEVTGLKISTLKGRAKKLLIKPDSAGLYFWSDMQIIRSYTSRAGTGRIKTHVYESIINLI